MVRGSEISLRSRGSGTDHRGVESESASSVHVVGALVKPDVVTTANGHRTNLHMFLSSWPDNTNMLSQSSLTPQCELDMLLILQMNALRSSGF